MSPPPRRWSQAHPLLYRVHEEPPPEKIEALREPAEAAGFTLAKGQVLKTAQLNRCCGRPRAPSMPS
jgi:exoribonuclease R